MAAPALRPGYSSTLARARCQTAGCGKRSAVLCDYPVRRRDGRSVRCNRHVCVACATARPGTREHFCPPHARAFANPLETAAPAVVIVCAACLMASCAHREPGFTCSKRGAAGTRTIGVAEWKKHLSFGVVT